MNKPTPSNPLAPKAATVFSGGPLLEHVAGIDPKAGSPMICTGSELACSPAIRKSTIFTGPQLNPSANCTHSTTGLPLASFCCGSDRDAETTEDRMRRPLDPVSTWMWSMVWQFELL